MPIKLLTNMPNAIPLLSSDAWYCWIFAGIVSLIALLKANYWNSTKKPNINLPIMTVEVVGTYLSKLARSEMKLENIMVFLMPNLGPIFPLRYEPMLKPILPISIRRVIILTI